MLEDTILSSPSQSSKSIRETRQIRKNKRKKKETDIGRSAMELSECIRDFYKDSEEESIDLERNEMNASTCLMHKPSAIISNYKPFEVEKTLAVADHIHVSQTKNQPNFPAEMQGFLNCTRLVEMELDNVKPKDFISEGKNSYFSITESEMINCCHQAEKILQDCFRREENIISASQELPPKEQDSILLVNSILEDFSQSPLSKEKSRINTFWQYTPEFRLHRQPVKTYSRKFLNTTKKNLNNRFVTVSEEEDDDLDLSNCSSLSIQEDVTVAEELSNNHSAITNFNDTERLCENLLNLSVYFKQNSQSHENLRNQQDANNSLESSLHLENVPDLINDILIFRSKYPNKQDYNSFNSLDDFYGYPSHNDNNESDNIDLVNDALDSMHTTLNIAHDLNICDNQIADISKIDKDISSLENWNEDECRDILAAFKTESILDNKIIDNSNQDTENVLDISSIDIPALQEKIRTQNCDTNAENEEYLEDVNIFEKPESDYEWNDDCDLFLNLQTPNVCEQNPLSVQVPQQKQTAPSTSNIAFDFQTAAGKNLHISRKAQAAVDKLLKDISKDFTNNCNYEEELKELKNKVYNKTRNSENKTSLNDIENIGDKSIGNVGFQTANGKIIAISAEAQQNVKSLLKEFYVENEQNFENDLKTFKQKINMKNNDIKKIIPTKNDLLKGNQEDIKNNSMNSYSIPHTNSIKSLTNNADLQTANAKKVKCDKAANCMDTLLKVIFKDTKQDDLKDLESIKENIITKRNNSSETEKVRKSNFIENNEDISNITLSEWPLPIEVETDKFKDCLGNCLLIENNETIIEKNFNTSSQIVNSNKDFILTKSQPSDKKLVPEFITDFDNKNCEDDSKELQIKKQYIQVKNSCNFNIKSSQNDNECSLSAKDTAQQRVRTKSFNFKRKHTIDSCDVGTTPAKVNKGLHNSKSSFTEQTLKSPLSTPSVISRKNLLSLTKRRKNIRNSFTISNEESPKINKEKSEDSVEIATPTKLSTLSTITEQTPATPNLKEFFSSAPRTSTPRFNDSSKTPNPIRETDFKPINWDKKNNDSIANTSTTIHSAQTTKFSDSLNVTLYSSNPTVKDRIGRLKMYGKAPAISPILIETHHSCRPSGLRRTRSMLKKTEK